MKVEHDHQNGMYTEYVLLDGTKRVSLTTLEAFGRPVKVGNHNYILHPEPFTTTGFEMDEPVSIENVRYYVMRYFDGIQFRHYLNGSNIEIV